VEINILDTLVGYTFTDWMQLLKENKYSISRKYINRALAVSMMSIMNSNIARKENHIYSSEIKNTSVEAPIFILGHWRSGTTLLHNLITHDKQFAYPNLFQTTHPHTFLTREEMVYKALANQDDQKRHMDNVRITFDSPGEDEPALAVLSLKSPVLGWVFPRNWEYYQRFLTFKNAKVEDLTRWSQGLENFMKKLTLRYKKRLILKSPPHTARVNIIKKIFPDTKFISIHRNPYHVFQSTRIMYEKVLPEVRLQMNEEPALDSRILTEYVDMYEAYFKDVKDLSQESHVEIRFEDLEDDMVGQVGLIYDRLNIAGFEKFKPELEKYVNSIREYQKNPHQDLSSQQKEKIVNAWGRNFENWKYSL